MSDQQRKVHIYSLLVSQAIRNRSQGFRDAPLEKIVNQMSIEMSDLTLIKDTES